VATDSTARPPQQIAPTTHSVLSPATCSSANVYHLTNIYAILWAEIPDVDNKVRGGGIVATPARRSKKDIDPVKIELRGAELGPEWAKDLRPDTAILRSSFANS
jgi:hypothetical protein